MLEYVKMAVGLRPHIKQLLKLPHLPWRILIVGADGILLMMM